MQSGRRGQGTAAAFSTTQTRIVASSGPDPGQKSLSDNGLYGSDPGRDVLDAHPQLDADRVGIFGGSYGGYSALMSVIRNPQLFKCAASFAGVTDLTLMFTQARTRDNKALREGFVRIIGNPDVDESELLQYSPVYRYKDISRPVLLAHGTDDGIVDIEHSWRLRKMLELSGNDPEFIVLDDVGHGFRHTGEAEKLYGPLIEFLEQNLQ